MTNPNINNGSGCKLACNSIRLAYSCEYVAIVRWCNPCYLEHKILLYHCSMDITLVAIQIREGYCSMHAAVNATRAESITSPTSAILAMPPRPSSMLWLFRSRCTICSSSECLSCDGGYVMMVVIWVWCTLLDDQMSQDSSQSPPVLHASAVKPFSLDNYFRSEQSKSNRHQEAPIAKQLSICANDSRCCNWQSAAFCVQAHNVP